MKIFFALFLVVVCVQNSLGSASTFKFDRFKDSCFDEFGRPGLNHNEIGECSDFSGLDLRNIDLSGKDLKGSYFINCNLDGVNFNGADLRGVKIQDSTLSGTIFENALFSETTVLLFDAGEIRKRKLRPFYYKDLDVAFEARSRYVYDEKTEEALSSFLDLGADPNVNSGSVFNITIRYGSIEIIRKMILSGAKVNAKIKQQYDEEFYPLNAAVKRNDPAIIAFLLDSKADTNKGVPLESAIGIKNYTAIELLLKAGADAKKLSRSFMVLTQDTKIWDLLFKSTTQYPIDLNYIYSMDQLKVAMNYGFKLSKQDQSGVTLLIKWILQDHPVEDIREILKYDCNINVVASFSFSQVSAFSLAVEKKRFKDVLPLLIQSGAIPTGRVFGTDVIAYMVKNYASNLEVMKLLAPFGKYLKDSFNTLLTCLNSENKELAPILDEMLKTGAVFDYTYNYPTYPILLYSIDNANSTLFNYLLEKNINVNVIYDRRSPLLAAAKRGNVSFVEALIKSGALVNAKVGGITALHEAKPDCGEVLIKAGADVNALSEYGKNTITFLRRNFCDEDKIDKEQVAYLRFLINAGINYKRVDSYGNSLLHILAAEDIYNPACNEKLITELSEFIPDFNVKNDLGQNALVSALPPLQYLSVQARVGQSPTFLVNQTSLVKLLLTKGADPKIVFKTAPDKGEVSLLQNSYQTFNMESMRVLKGLGVKDFRWTTQVMKKNTWTRADCDFFDTRKGYKIAQGGCLSSSGLVWSKPFLNTNWRKDDYEKYCTELQQGNRTDWKPVTNMQLQTEAVRSGLKANAWKKIISSDSFDWSNYVYSYDPNKNIITDESLNQGKENYYGVCVAEAQIVQ